MKIDNFFGEIKTMLKIDSVFRRRGQNFAVCQEE